MKRWITVFLTALVAGSLFIGATAAQDVPSSASADERARLELLEQKTQLLVDRHLANATALEEQLDFDAAEAELLAARDLAPTNSDVTSRLAQVQAVLGRPEGTLGALSVGAASRLAARQQQMRSLALQEMQDARAAMDVGNFDHAAALARGVVNRTRTATDVDWGTIGNDARSLLTQAESGQMMAADTSARAREQAAYERLRAEEQRELSQKQDKIDALTRSAVDAFLANDFETAEELALAVLDEDAANTQALEIVDSARDASRGHLKRTALDRRRETFRTWRETMEEVRIPYASILTAPDKERWEEITRLRGGGRSLNLAATDPEVAALRARLAATTMDADFDDLTIQQVANNIFFNTDVPVSVDPEVVTELDDNAETVTLQGLADISVESLLNILVDQVGDELAWTIRNGRVYVTKLEKASGNPVVRIHNIQDLTFPLTDFKGVSIRDIALPGEAGDDNETTIFNSELERIRLIEPDEIESLIRENIARESWDLSDAFSIGFSDNNNLLVVHTPEVQNEIIKFLDNLRAFSTSMVTLESRFIAITDAFIEEIGTDLRGLGPAGNLGNEVTLDDIDDPLATQSLDNNGTGSDPPKAGLFYGKGSGTIAASAEQFFTNPLGDILSTVGGGAFQFAILNDTQVNLVITAVQKSQNAFEITAPTVSVFNTQRAFVTVVNQISFVQGFDVDVANAARIADPIIGILQEGIVLDVRPTISYDRKYITLDVQTTVADVERFETFETNLGSDIGGSVEFQLPELDVQDARTTVVVPDGGSVVIGGFKNVTYRNRTAEVPWLSQIPILGFFFQEKGLADEMTDLMIVMRAKVTDFTDLQRMPVSDG